MTKQPYESAPTSASQGQEFWRSLEEYARTPAFEEWLGREFPQGAAEMRDPASRRRFLKLMGASLALAGLTGCQFAIKPPARTIVPYVRQPELVIPGRPLYYATGIVQQGFAMGLLAESHEGRPTKVEGNPDHPSSRGATDRFAQASLLTMYDPDRSTGVRQGTTPSTWANFVAAATAALGQQAGNQGAGVRLLTTTTTSPSLVADIQRVLQTLPQAKWYQYEPLARDGANDGMRLAFGQDAHVVYDFTKADVIVALDSDFLADGVGSVRYARDYATRRRVRKDKTFTNRLYVAEPTPTSTGTLADHRLPIRASAIESLARAIATAAGVIGIAAGSGLSEEEAKWAAAVGADLQAVAGSGLVIVGDGQPGIVHALAYAINKGLGNAGNTVRFLDPLEPNPANQVASLATLVGEMNAGQVQVLLMLGGNPVYNAPADLDFTTALSKVPLSIHHSLYVDETSSVASWHVNATHYLEEWGDALAHDGTATIIQPLIAPLYGGKSASEVLNALLGTEANGGYPALTEYWRQRGVGGDFDKGWFKVLHDGIVGGTAAKTLNLAVKAGFDAQATAPVADLEIVFRPDPAVGDGSYANSGWMQVLPKPITKLTWDNAIYLSPATAAELGVKTEDVVEVTFDGRSIQGAVMIVQGQADKSVVVFYGYGRTAAGQTAAKTGGYNAFALRTSQAPYFGGGAQVRAVGTRYELATTQLHFALEGRKKDIVPSGTLNEFLENEHFLHEEAHHEIISLFPAFEYKGYAWGMSIDLNVCSGCNACVVACTSENNINIVPKDQVRLGREMQWIRLDQYYVGDAHNPEIYTQPMMCQHCELAPCELVCPVAATSHDSEGLNVMTYNRCVGTKYCSNNCPFKVRRFNFFQYADETTPSLKIGRNPDVSVRSRGVMEKCTYCVQRINEARIDAEREGRTIQDGEVITACQQVCPTQAIVFGDINDPNAQVTQLKAEPLTFTVLDKLNVKPRTSYMARLRNVNPALGGGETKTE